MIHHLLYGLLGSLAVCPLADVQQTGWATWYGDGNYHGAVRADGDTFDPDEIGCAHRSIPLGTEIIVEAKDSGRMITCEINDRGPYAVDDPTSDRGWCNALLDDDCVGEPRAVLDLSLAAARELWNTGDDEHPPNGDVILRY